MQRLLAADGYHDEIARTLRELEARPRLDREEEAPRHVRRALAALVGRRPAAATPTAAAGVTIRPGRPTDAGALAELAAMCERRLPRGPVLVAEVGSEIVAVLPVAGGPAVTDLRWATADVVQLLELRSHQERLAAGGARAA